MKKILSVVGARPQFIKAAMVSPLLRKKYKEILVHTGQHYDYNMSEQFFEELDIPRADYNLGISGGSHAEMTGRMLIAIEEVLIREKPDILLVYGDTNSTLSAALSAAKLKIPIFHVEAGVRTHCMTNPEEINRICTDHVSTKLMANTEESMRELSKEGLGEKSILTGDLMYDAFIKHKDRVNIQELKLKTLFGEDININDEFYYMTCHREENTSDDKIEEILSAMEELDAKTIYPVHPRNNERIKRLNEEKHYRNIQFVEPVGYMESIALVNGAKKIVTDSGGVQREAFFARKQCITVLDFPVWIETMVENRNVLAKPLKEDILLKLSRNQKVDNNYMPFGDGNAAQKILSAINDFMKQ